MRCPDADVLVAFIADDVDTWTRERVAAHLEGASAEHFARVAPRHADRRERVEAWIAAHDGAR